MSIPTSKQELTDLFRKLGAPNPEQWAASQVDEGIPQLARYLFLKAAWENIPAEGDNRWIDREIEDASKHPDQPYAGLGLALARCRQQGVTDADLVAMGRCLRAQMLMSIGYVMDGPAFSQPVEGLSWGLFQTDEDGRPFGEQITGLHESVLQLDPTGREMRPK